MYKPLLFSLCAAISVPSAWAYDEESGVRFDLTVENQPSSKVVGSQLDFEQKSTQLSLEKFWELDRSNALSLGLELQQRDITTKALLPGANAVVPDTIKGATFNLTWMRELESGKSLRISNSIGSMSDKPFKGSGALSYNLEAFLISPTETGNAWMFGMAYSNEDDDFGASSLLPMVAYQWNKSETFNMTIGLPFLELNWIPHERVEVMAMVAGKDPEVSTNFYLSEDTSIGFSYGQGGWTGRRFARADKKAFLNYEEKRTAITLSHYMGPAVLSVSGGLITDRKLDENSDGGTRSNQSLKIKDTSFVSLNIGMEF